jgi:hypothetical protein
MIKTPQGYSVAEILNPEDQVRYAVPTYQREYVWGQREWDALIDDLIEHEGRDGHFLGMFICVNHGDAQYPRLEIIDGQQRLTTISILLAVIYQTLMDSLDRENDDAVTDVTNLKRMMAVGNEPRLTPQISSSNRDDFQFVLRQAGLPIEQTQPSRFGNRQIARARNYFVDRLGAIAESTRVTQSAAAMDLLGRIKRAQLVKLEVDTYSDAYKLFESLNNRGKPLTPIDLLKNTLLAAADQDERSGGTLSVKSVYARWREWLAALGDDYSTQERFFRQLYSAMREEWELAVPKVPVATKSNLIDVYETLIKRNVAQLVEQLTLAASAFHAINEPLLDPDDSRPREVRDSLQAIQRAQGTPAHILLLFLSLTSDRRSLSADELLDIANLLVAFSVRRNLTNTPPTNALPRLYMDIIDELRSSPDEPVLKVVRDKLTRAAASDDTFLERLRGPIYAENAGVARFVLVALAERRMTDETRKDLWERRAESGRDTYLWTIEHVLPQTENLPSTWVLMLDDDLLPSRDLVDHLGNLTVSAYNSRLSTMGFLEKRDRQDEAGRFIGYRNQLSLNADLASLESWGSEAIDDRTDRLARAVLELFPL